MEEDAMGPDVSGGTTLSDKGGARFEIHTAQEKCSGCKTCQLWCAFTWTDSINPIRSNIRQEFVPGKGFRIFFLEGCKRCGICADHCEFGALIKEKTDRTRIQKRG